MRFSCPWTFVAGWVALPEISKCDRPRFVQRVTKKTTRRNSPQRLSYLTSIAMYGDPGLRLMRDSKRTMSQRSPTASTNSHPSNPAKNQHLRRLRLKHPPVSPRTNRNPTRP